MWMLKGWKWEETLLTDPQGISSPWALEAGWGCVSAWFPRGSWKDATEHLYYFFRYFGTKRSKFLLQMCSSMSNRGWVKENLLSDSSLFLKQLRVIL